MERSGLDLLKTTNIPLLMKLQQMRAAPRERNAR
jgi:hypothetical protein